MLCLLDWGAEGAVLKFTWADDSFDEQEREQLTPWSPIVTCYHETLVPLAGERGEQLTPEEVLRAVVQKAGGACTPPLAIDWLGLALYAAQRFREAMAKLAAANTPESRAEISAAHPLARLLEQIYNRMVWAMSTPLRQAGCCGAA